jgi:hypothetical protein
VQAYFNTLNAAGLRNQGLSLLSLCNTPLAETILAPASDVSPEYLRPKKHPSPRWNSVVLDSDTSILGSAITAQSAPSPLIRASNATPARRVTERYSDLFHREESLRSQEIVGSP